MENWPAQFERGLRTSSLTEAKLAAADRIKQHQFLLIFHEAAKSPNFEGYFGFKWVMEPGTESVHPDGSMTIATDTEILEVSPDRQITRHKNGKRYYFTPSNEILPGFENVIPPDDIIGFSPRVVAAIKEDAEVSDAQHRDADSEVIDNYIRAKVKRGSLGGENDLSGDQGSLRRTFEDFKKYFPNLLLREALASDVEALVDHLMEGNGITAARTKKLLSYMRAAINYDMRDRKRTKFTYNPFDKFEVPTDEDAENRMRKPFTEAEMAAIRAALPDWPDESRLLYVWHTSTSVRPVGLYSIVDDAWEEAVDHETGQTHHTRYVMIRNDKPVPGKINYGRRALPIPQAVLELGILPDRITGPIFLSPRPSLLIGINKRIRQLQVEGTPITKSLYCGRHRARDRLRGTEEEMRRAIMGHSRTVTDAHDRYGHGYPMWQVKRWIDKIGY